VGKKAEGYRQRWVFMDARRASPLLMTPVAPAEQGSEWGHKRLVDPREKPILELIATHGDAKLTGAAIVKEFLGIRITLLQARSRLVWEYTSVGDAMRLHATGLTTEELDEALGALLGYLPEDPPEAASPLYIYENPA
jgi:hypothetical protein